MDDLHWLRLACELAALCPPSQTAFSVGAVIVGRNGAELARGYSRENNPLDHAEESSLAKIVPGTDLSRATIYTSLEPCGERKSRPKTCSELIIESGIKRAVFAWREPSIFVHASGTDRLRAQGVDVTEHPDLASLARIPNEHLVPNQ